MTEQKYPDGGLSLVMTFRSGNTAEVINECFKQGFVGFEKISCYVLNDKRNRTEISVNYSPEYACTAWDWLTSAPNPLILGYCVKRRGY